MDYCTSSAPSTSRENSMFPRVAWLYGQTFSCVSSTRARASPFGSVETLTTILTAMPKPPPSRGPTEVWHVTIAPFTSFLCCRATNSRAPPKQAAYPAANRCRRCGVGQSGATHLLPDRQIHTNRVIGSLRVSVPATRVDSDRGYKRLDRISRH